MELSNRYKPKKDTELWFRATPLPLTTVRIRHAPNKVMTFHCDMAEAVRQQSYGQLLGKSMDNAGNHLMLSTCEKP